MLARMNVIPDAAMQYYVLLWVLAHWVAVAGAVVGVPRDALVGERHTRDVVVRWAESSRDAKERHDGYKV